MTKKRVSYIDMAKGIGILLVLIGHSEFPSTNLITWISTFHMPLFFILSGMLFSHTGAFQKPWKTFLTKKAKSILLPYGVFSILSILASAILDFGAFPEYLWTSLFQTVSFYGISVLWFLPALFFSETGFYFIRKHTSTKGTAIAMTGILGLSILGNELFHRYYSITDSYANMFIYYLLAVLIRSGIAMTYLAIGYFLYKPFTSCKLSAGNYLVLSAGFLILNLFLGFQNGGVDLNQLVFRNYILYYLASFCGSMFIICLCNFLPDIASLLYLGKNSLIIMVTHMNCRFYGASFLVADLFLKLLPQAGLFGYYLVVVVCMTLLEVIAITIINRFFPLLIGKPGNKFRVIAKNNK